jgi:hypothetical protein
MEFVGRVATAFGQLSPEVQKSILIIAGLFAASGPLMLAINGFIALVTTAFGPVGLIAAAIMGLVYVWQRWGEDIKALISEVIEAMKIMWDAFVQIKDYIVDVVKMLWEKVTGFFGKMRDRITSISTAIKDNTIGIFGEMANGMVEKVEGAVKRVEKAFQWLRDKLSWTPPDVMGRGFSEAAKKGRDIAREAAAREAAGGARSAERKAIEEARAAVFEAAAESIGGAGRPSGPQPEIPKPESGLPSPEDIAGFEKSIYDIGAAFDFNLGKISNNIPDIHDWFSKIADQVEYLGMPLETAVAKLKSMRESLVPLSDEWKRATDMIRQYESQINDTEKATDDLVTKSDMWAKSLTDGIADAIVEGRSLLDVLQQIGKAILKSTISRALPGLFGIGIGGWHTGGVIGQDQPTFMRGIKSYHTGGLVGAGEELAILHQGEAVFTPAQLDALGSVAGDNVNITMNVNAVDARSFVDLLSRNKATVESIVVNSIWRNDKVRKVIKGAT